MLLLIPYVIFSFVAVLLHINDFAFDSVQLTGKNGIFKLSPQLAYLLYYETEFKSSCFERVFSIFFIFFKKFFHTAFFTRTHARFYIFCMRFVKRKAGVEVLEKRGVVFFEKII
jgi:hypothetical protein